MLHTEGTLQNAKTNATHTAKGCNNPRKPPSAFFRFGLKIAAMQQVDDFLESKEWRVEWRSVQKGKSQGKKYRRGVCPVTKSTYDYDSQVKAVAAFKQRNPGVGTWPRAESRPGREAGCSSRLTNASSCNGQGNGPLNLQLLLKQSKSTIQPLPAQRIRTPAVHGGGASICATGLSGWSRNWIKGI